MAELKREHAIETGIVERLYELDKDLAETFIKKPPQKNLWAAFGTGKFTSA